MVFLSTRVNRSTTCSVRVWRDVLPRRRRRPAEVRLVGEVGGVDDERVAFPASARMPGQILRSPTGMRAPIEGDDADVVHHLVADDDGVARLQDLEVGVVGRRDHRRPDVAPADAALGQRSRLRAVGDARPGAIGDPRGLALSRLGSQRRQLPVARIGDERRAQPNVLRIVLILPDGIVVVDVVLRLGEELIAPLLGVGGRFFGREGLLVAELGRTLERRDGVVGPEALQVGLAVRCSRHSSRGRSPGPTPAHTARPSR